MSDKKRKANKLEKLRLKCVQAARQKPVMAGVETGKASEGYKKGRLAIKAKVKQYRVEVSWHGKI